MQPAPHIVYTPIPDSPFPDLSTPPRVNPNMRSDSYLYSPRPRPRPGLRSSLRPRPGHSPSPRHQPPRRHWGDVIPEEEVRQPQEARRIFRGKWGRQCKRPTCKNPFLPRPPPPPPPPPAAAIAVHGGTRRRACKNKRRTRRAGK
jgi:hypothetical protein